MNGTSKAGRKAIKEAEKKAKAAEKARKAESKRAKRIAALQKKKEYNIAQAEYQESLARRRQARKKAKTLHPLAHPLGLGKRSMLGKTKIRKSKKSVAWYDRL